MMGNPMIQVRSIRQWSGRRRGRQRMGRSGRCKWYRGEDVDGETEGGGGGSDVEVQALSKQMMNDPETMREFQE
eukprot:766377-Hanusia_phi.AAC.1